MWRESILGLIPPSMEADLANPSAMLDALLADAVAAARAEWEADLSCSPAAQPDREALADPTTDAVNDLAGVLLIAWEDAEGKPVTPSYVATFADMARAALRRGFRRHPEGTTVTEWGVRWVDVAGRHREVGQVESSGVLPGGDVGHFTEEVARCIAGTRQRVVSRQRTRRSDVVTEWVEGDRADPIGALAQPADTEGA